MRSQGNLVATSEREALSMLDARGLFPLRIAPAKTARKGGRRIRSRNLAAFYAQLADLLHSGVPLLRSLDILERQSSQAALSEVLREVRARVADGMALAEAMAQHPRAFDELAVSMVRAGQEGGFLEDVLRRIADFTEQQEDLKAKVIGALAYPIFLAVAGFVILNVLIIFFVPKFEPIFKRLAEKGELPTLTVGLIAFSHFLQGWGWAVVVAVVGLVDRLPPLGRHSQGPDDGRRLRLAHSRSRGKSTCRSPCRASRASSAPCCTTASRSCTPCASARTRPATRCWRRPSRNRPTTSRPATPWPTPLAACKHFPRDVVEMIAVGEESNNLDKVLIDIANGLEKRTSRQLELFVRLLEPMMLLVMAAIVLLVVAGLLLPVFKMSSVVQ